MAFYILIDRIFCFIFALSRRFDLVHFCTSFQTFFSSVIPGGLSSRKGWTEGLCQRQSSTSPLNIRLKLEGHKNHLALVIRHDMASHDILVLR